MAGALAVAVAMARPLATTMAIPLAIVMAGALAVTMARPSAIVMASPLQRNGQAASKIIVNIIYLIHFWSRSQQRHISEERNL
jgi:hypothetical protein